MQQALNQQKLQIQAEYKRMSEEKEKNNSELLQRSLQVAQATRPVVTGTIGSMQQFTFNDDWTVWHERLEQHFIANDMLNGKKGAVFITLLSAEAYTLLRDLCSPDVPSQKTIAQLATIMKDHLQPKPSCITERYKFKERRQQAGENVKQYIASLKKLSIHCEFGNNLENQLRDQFAWGLKCDATKKRLLGEKDLTYQKAMETATALEAATRDIAEMQGSRNSTDAANISFIARRKGKQIPNSPSKAATKCYCCGKPNHKSSECRFREYERDNYASLVSPLYELVRKDTPFTWTRKCDEAFEATKSILASRTVLMHYSLQLPIKLTCDASPTGVGAVLSHVLPNGETKPVSYASRALNKAERGYSQLDREALAIFFGVKIHHQYLYGREFILKTDHKPLTFIFGSKEGLPQMAASRLQRWAVFLSGYNFEIQHVRGADNVVADGLSRINMNELTDKTVHEEYSYLNYVENETNAIDGKIVRHETRIDPTLIEVMKHLNFGWPNQVDPELLPYKNRCNSLTIEQDCIMFGHRIVIPKALRGEVLSELHAAHMGIVRMKAIARPFVWCPNIDADIENVSKSCALCVENACNSLRSPLITWNWPNGPNRRIHADFLRPIENNMYLIIIDAFSKWVDVKRMSNIKTSETITAFKQYFSTWGLPTMLVTDNGPSFTAKLFANFLANNGIKHVLTPPFHAASNGAAENAVRSFKTKFKLLMKESGDKDESLLKYLFYYRSSPHCKTGCSPAELQFNRSMRARLDLIRPDIRKNVERQQSQQKKYFHGNRQKEFEIDEIVAAKDYRYNNWRPATVENRLRNNVYEVRTDDNRIWKRHTDQLCTSDVYPSQTIINNESSNVENIPCTSSPKTHSPVELNNKSDTSPAKDRVVSTTIDQTKVHSPRTTSSPVPMRRSTRVAKPRKILDYSEL
ncbi:hypothetical protein TKK_0008096 [Trichogramma kaykai]